MPTPCQRPVPYLDLQCICRRFCFRDKSYIRHCNPGTFCAHLCRSIHINMCNTEFVRKVISIILLLGVTFLWSSTVPCSTPGNLQCVDVWEKRNSNVLCTGMLKMFFFNSIIELLFGNALYIRQSTQPQEVDKHLPANKSVQNSGRRIIRPLRTTTPNRSEIGCKITTTTGLWYKGYLIGFRRTSSGFRRVQCLEQRRHMSSECHGESRSPCRDRIPNKTYK